MTREEARAAINGRPLTDFIALEVSRKAGRNMYVCPICGSGKGRKGTGALHIYPDTCRVFCYSNGCFSPKGEDTLGALRKIWQCSEADVFERVGYIIDRSAPAPAPNRKENMERGTRQEEKDGKDYTSFYSECHHALKASPEALAYLHGRGITDESIDRFSLGYCGSWKHSKAGSRVPTTKRIIIPRTARTYTARRIDSPKNDIEASYAKQVQGRQKDLFSLDALSRSGTPIICEGEIDAISLYQAGAESVVAIGTTTNAGILLEEAKKHPESVFILALDNDPVKEDGTSPGRDAQRKLATDMVEAGLSVLNFDPKQIYGDAKDGNEAFTKNPERLGKVVAWLEGKAQEIKASLDAEREAELRKRTGEGMLEDFLLTVSKRDFEPIATGISDLDRALQGGFIRKTLVLLGAPPAMGKTALAQWIFENIAKAGQDVLYINLEMSREQLLARSLSRLVWRNEKKDVSSLDVLRGYEWDDEIRNAVFLAAGSYKRDIAGHFIYNPDGVTNHVDSILKAMEDEATRIKEQGRPTPLVCIDYLQLIDSGERDAIEGLKGVIFKLKDFAKRENTVVFVIMANNRASNRSGVVEMESGRDTSAIEYSGDVMLGLSYTAIEDRRKYVSGTDKNGNPKYEIYDLEAIRRLKKDAYEAREPVPSVCNEISLKVLKNRFGESERRVNLLFDGKHSTFSLVEAHRKEPTMSGWVEYNGESPWDK